MDTETISKFSHSVMSNYLQLHGLKDARLPCPSPISGTCSNSCSLSRWCHPAISSSVVPFSSCLQSFPPSGYFLVSQFFTSGGQSTRISASAISPSNEYSGLISFWMDKLNLLAVQGTLKSILQYQFKSINSLALSFFIVQLSHPYMTTGETVVLIKWTFVGKLMYLLFFQGARVFSLHGFSHLCSDFGAPKICHCFHCFPVYVPQSNGPRCLDLSFLNVEF